MNHVLSLQSLETNDPRELLGWSTASNHCSSASNSCEVKERELS